MKMIRAILTLSFIIFPLFLYSQENDYSMPEDVVCGYEGLNYIRRGQYEKAIPCLEKAWDLYQRDKNKTELDYGALSISLGRTYCEVGRYGEAEDIYLKAYDMLKDDYSNSMEYRTLLSVMGGLYTSLKNYEKAENCFAESKYLFEDNLDFGDNYVNCLVNYGVLLSYSGNYVWAKFFLDIALDYALKSNDEDVIGAILDSSSSVYLSLGYFEEAKTMIGKAMNYGNEHNSENIKSVTYNNYGWISWEAGDAEEAVKYMKLAFDTNDDFEQRVVSGFNLLNMLYSLEDEDYIDIARLLSSEIKDMVVKNFLFMSSGEKELYWNHYAIYILWVNFYLSKALSFEDIGLIYNNALFMKGLLLRTSRRLKRAIQEKGDEEALKLFDEIMNKRRMLAEGKIPNDSIDLINEQIDKIDKQLVKQSAEYVDFKNDFLDWKKIRNSLEPNEVAIEFIQLPKMKGDTIDYGVDYAALLIGHKYKSPKLIRLCSDSQLNTVLSEDVTTLNTFGRKSQLSRYINSLYVNNGLRGAKGDKLYSLIWEPLESELLSVKKIYYSPVGILNQISFAAICDREKTLIEKYDLILLSSTSEILDLNRKGKDAISDAIFYGGISYDAEEKDLLMAAYVYPHSETEKIQLASRGDERWGLSELAGTLSEVKDISTLLDSCGISSIILSGCNANEESFKALDGHSPYIIHLATHGFFLSDERTILRNPFMQKHNINVVSYKNSLNRAGLCLAGANRAWTNTNIIDGIEDGILTAAEIMNLDLTGTELVVLSACETGLGDVVSSEGVFGLQRALKLAGVKTIMMSLWKVDDHATMDFMNTFYQNWVDSRDKRVAFMKTQKQIMAKYESPYYWAGFVMLD